MPPGATVSSLVGPLSPRGHWQLLLGPGSPTWSRACRLAGCPPQRRCLPGSLHTACPATRCLKKDSVGQRAPRGPGLCRQGEPRSPVSCTLWPGRQTLWGLHWTQASPSSRTQKWPCLQPHTVLVWVEQFCLVTWPSPGTQRRRSEQRQGLPGLGVRPVPGGNHAEGWTAPTGLGRAQGQGCSPLCSPWTLPAQPRLSRDICPELPDTEASA